MNYPVYNIEFDEVNDYGLMGISFVDYPAICENFVYFSKQNEPQLFINAEKHEVVSPVLIPGQLILRVDGNGNKYYVRWSKETIEKVARHYIAEQRSNNYSYMHQWFYDSEGEYEDTLLKGVYTLGMWLIEDEKTDKANKEYGYHLPAGTLMVHIKVHNRNLWKKIKDGEVKGLSIEAFIHSVEAGRVSYTKNKNKNNKLKMSKAKIKDLFDQFLLWYSQVSDEASGLADVAKNDETESGEVSLKYYTSDTDYIEIDADGTARGSDGEVVADGEYRLSDGNILVVEDGKFKETKGIDETDETEPVEAPIAENCDDEEKKDEEETQEAEDDDEAPVNEEEKPEESVEETPEPASEEPEKDEETQEEVEAPYTLVEIEINGEMFNVPQEVADYIKTLEEAAGMAENFRKELARLQSVTPSAKPVGNAIKQETEKTDKDSKIADTASLIANMNKRLK